MQPHLMTCTELQQPRRAKNELKGSVYEKQTAGGAGNQIVTADKIGSDEQAH